MQNFFSVEPTIKFGNQQEAVILPASSQMSATGEQIITLDLDPEHRPGPSAGFSTVRLSRSRGKGIKRTNSNTNTAKTYGDIDSDVGDADVNYPAFLYQEPPRKLKTEDLRKHALITKIKKDQSIATFFDLAKGVLGPLKNALIKIAGQQVPNNNGSGDHDYQATNPTLD